MAIFNPKLLTELAIDVLDYAIGVMGYTCTGVWEFSGDSLQIDL